MSKKYGSTFSAKLGNQLLVVLSDYKSIKKAFRKEAFSGRPENEISAIIEGYGEYT
jgi:26-hydroxylase